jgi:ApbE superfamily uncharacterized protein (UPF0280 family)
MFEPRIYRERVNKDRFIGRKIVHEESDLWIGVDTESFPKVNFELIENQLIEGREALKSYIKNYPDFQNSLVPVKTKDNDPDFILKLKEAGIKTGTGPMAGIAGFFAEETAGFIKQKFQVNEVIVENGGDICLWINENLNLAIHSGKNQNFNNLGLEILPEKDYIGICSSSGIFGHSLSLGKSDLLMVIANDTVLADSWATSLANRIKEERDIDLLVKKIPENLKAVLAVKDEKMAYKGDYRIIRLS